LSGETTADMVPDSHSYEVVNNIGAIIEIIERGNTV